MKKFVEALLVARENERFQKLVKMGLVARDLVAVRVFAEKRERLALLCEASGKAYAVVCVNSSIPVSMLVGHALKAKTGVVLDKKPDWVQLSGHYEGLKAPLVVAEDVSIRKMSDNSVG